MVPTKSWDHEATVYLRLQSGHKWYGSFRPNVFHTVQNNETLATVKHNYNDVITLEITHKEKNVFAQDVL